ncbi:hypothetical protein Q9L58_008681 [Maublancomyces gigas]|uniref:Uncharacterized protein n=1 Tax=Discina gigas TaxID=1032678 RepID=A0ABR3G8Z1_9PEZI
MSATMFSPVECQPLQEIAKWVTASTAEIESLRTEIKSLREQIDDTSARNTMLTQSAYNLQSSQQEKWQGMVEWRGRLEDEKNSLAADRTAIDSLRSSIIKLANTIQNDIQARLNEFTCKDDGKIVVPSFNKRML